MGGIFGPVTRVKPGAIISVVVGISVGSLKMTDSLFPARSRRRSFL